MRLNTIYGLAIGALMGGMMVSCSNDLSDPSYVASNGDQVNLVKAPDVIAWSGEQVLGNTFSSTTRATSVGNTSYNWDWPSEMDKLKNISIPENAVALKSDWQFDQNASSYYVPAGVTINNYVNVPSNFKGDLYIAGTFEGNLGNNGYVNLYILEGGECTITGATTNGNVIYNAGTLNFKIPGSELSKVNGIYSSGDINFDNPWGDDYDYQVNTYCSNGVITFEDSFVDIKKDIVAQNKVIANKIKFQQGNHDICELESTGLVEIVNGNNSFALIKAPNLKFDGAKIKLHPEGFIDITNDVTITNSGCAIQPFASGYKGLVKCSTLNVLDTGDQPSSIFPDGIYFNLSSNNLTFSPDNHNGYNWIVDRINTTMTVTPSCGAASDPDDPDPEVPEIPETPEGEKDPILHNNEVEVNLAILDQHEFPDFPEGIADLVTKLSIHVRCATDVEIKIPVPNKYVIESDDLVIFNNHLEGNGAYGGTLTELLEENATKTLSYVVAGQMVTLTVSFENDNIVVRTSGINQAVIDYCEEKYGDGINFEIYNYYQMVKQVWDKDDEFSHVEATDPTGTDLTKDMLFGFLDDSTIEFLNKKPDYYINAFGQIVNDTYNDEGEHDRTDNTGELNTNHAKVVPVAEQSAIDVKEERMHLNGTPFNTIYYYTNKPDDGHIHTIQCEGNYHYHD